MRRKTFILVVYVCMYEFLKLPSVSLFIVDGNTKTEPSQPCLSVNNLFLIQLEILNSSKGEAKKHSENKRFIFCEIFFLNLQAWSLFFWVHHLLAPTAPKHGVVLHQRERRKRFKTEIPNHAFLAAWESFNLPQHTYVLHRKTIYIIFTRPIKSFLINLR